MKKTKLNESIRIAKEGIGECWDDMAGATGQTPEGQGEGPMTVTINMPGKNISVTTDSADEIANILKLAGIQVGGVSADAEMPAEMPSAEEPAVMYVGAEPTSAEVPGDNDGDGDHDMHDHEIEHQEHEDSESAEEEAAEDDEEDEVEEAVGDKSYTSKGGTVTQTATGLTHQAGSGVYGGTETDSEEEARKKADDKAAKKELGEAPGIMISGKEVDIHSCEVDGVDSRDYPDFADAYISHASFVDGTDLNDDELNQLNDQHGDIANELAFDSLHESTRILELAGVTNEAQSAAQKAAFAKMIAAKGGKKSDDKDDNKKPDADGDGVPDWADKDKEVKEEAPATNSIFGQGVYETSYARILELAGLEESKLMNSPANTSMNEPKVYDSLPSGNGTGKGRPDFGANRANGQGENPMGDGSHTVSVEEQFERAMGEYRKFVSESISRKK
jgi:hypothetical protein